MWGAPTGLVHLKTVIQGLWIEVLCFICPSNNIGGKWQTFIWKLFFVSESDAVKFKAIVPNSVRYIGVLLPTEEKEVRELCVREEKTWKYILQRTERQVIYSLWGKWRGQVSGRKDIAAAWHTHTHKKFKKYTKQKPKPQTTTNPRSQKNENAD